MSTNLSKLADELKPYIVPWVRRIASGNGGGAGGGGTPDMLAHVLATTSALGTFHTVAGLTAGQVLKATGATTAAFGTLSHTLLSDLLTGDPHTQYALRSLTLTAGDGLTGGGTLAANRTFTLGTPGTLAYNTTNAVTATSHTHAITTNWDVSTVDAILQSSGGDIKVDQLVAVNSVTTPALISTATLTFTPGTYAILSDGKSLRTATFASGFAGSGFRLDQGVETAGVTSLTLDNLYVRGLMHVYELLIHKIRATNGSIIVANTGKVTVRSLSSGTEGAVDSVYACRCDPETLHGFVPDDLVRAQRFTGTGVYQSSCKVVAPTGGVGVDADLFYLQLVSGVAPQVGYDYVRLGNVSDASRRGGIYMTADDSGAPFIDVWNGVTAFTGTTGWGAAGTLKMRMGRLDGITGDTNVYGLWAGSQTLGNVYITGTKVALRQGTDEVITLGSDGASKFLGRMTIGTGGEIVQGSGTLGTAGTWTDGVAWGTFTGLRLGNASGVGRLGGYSAGVLQAGFNSSGQITAGGGVVNLDASGIWVEAPVDATADASSYRFKEETYGYEIGGLYGMSAFSTVPLKANFIQLLAKATGSYGGSISITATAAALGGGSIDLNGSVYADSTLRVAGVTTLGNALDTTTDTTLELKQSGTSILRSLKDTNSSYLRLGAGRTVDGISYLDMVGDATYSTYGFRFQRAAGANGTTSLTHRGTGLLYLYAQEAAEFRVYTSSAQRMNILATGETGIGGAASAGNGALQVTGLLRTGDASKASFAPLNTFTLAADATVSLGTDTFAWGWLLNVTDQTMTQITLRGTGDLVNLNATNGAFTTVAGTANNINVYNSANVYYIQNKYAATRTLALYLFYAQ